MKVEEIMTRAVVSIHQDAAVQEAARLVADRGISGLPVVDDRQRVVGVITEGDLIKRLRQLELPAFIDLFGGTLPLKSNRQVEAEIREMAASRVRDLMSRQAVTVGPDTEIRDLANLLLARNIKRAPVIDHEGTLIGIVSRTDVVRTLVDQPPQDAGG